MEVQKAMEAKKSGAVAQQSAETLNEWGVEYSQEDVTVPKLLMMQPMSQMVTGGEAAFGELRDSMQKKVFADFAKDLEFIPFYLQRSWVEYEMVETSQKGSVSVEKVYRRTFPVNSNPSSPDYNDKLRYEDIIEEDGKKVKIQRDRVANFFVLLLNDMPGGIPHVIPFRRTSARAGKALATQMFVTNIAAKKTPASAVFKLRIKKQSKGSQTWASMEVETTRASTDAEVAIAKTWLERVRGSKVKVDESADNEAAAEAHAEVSSAEPTNF